MQTIITVEYGDVEEAVRCIRWAAGKTRLALAKHWSSCLIAGLGIVGFLGSLADTDRAQVFCVLMGFGLIGLLLQAIRRRLKYSDEMLKRILQIQGIRLILYEKGILSDTGKRSWLGIKLLVGKETVALMSSVQVYLAIPKAELTDEQLAQIRGWIQAAKKLRQEEERREDQEYICWGEVKRMCFLGFIHLGNPVLVLSFLLVLALIVLVLFHSMSAMVWRALMGVCLGMILLGITMIAEAALYRCIWFVDEERRKDPNAPDMKLYWDRFLKKEISEASAKEVLLNYGDIRTIRCKHGKIILYGTRLFVVLYRNSGRGL